MHRARAGLIAGWIGLSLSACSGLPSFRSKPPPLPPPPPPTAATPYDQDRSWNDLQALAALGAQPAGAPESAAIREYLTRELEAIGLEVDTFDFELTPPGHDEPITIHHVAAMLPGESDDMFLFLTSIDSLPESWVEPGAADREVSGAALLLELARQFKAEPLPYTTWFVFIDGDEPFVPGRPGAWGSNLFADTLATNGDLGRVRLAVLFHSVAGENLSVPRDLLSNRPYRETFWREARKLGHSDTFPAKAGFEDIGGAPHLALVDRGLGRTVVIAEGPLITTMEPMPPVAPPVAEAPTPEAPMPDAPMPDAPTPEAPTPEPGATDESAPAAPPPPAATAVPAPEASTEPLAGCSPNSLEAVGQVTLAATRSIAALQRRVDRLVPARPEPEALPEQDVDGDEVPESDAVTETVDDMAMEPAPEAPPSFEDEAPETPEPESPPTP